MWATGQEARNSALTYRHWAELGDKGRALNAAGLALTITGGSLVAAGAIWRIVGAKKYAPVRLLSSRPGPMIQIENCFHLRREPPPAALRSVSA